MSADLIARLIEAGTPAALVAEVAMELGKAEAERSILAERRKNERDRKARSRDITGHNVTARDGADTPPVLDKETSPTPPKEINPTPRVRRAREAGTRLPDDWKPLRFNDGTVAREVIDRRGQEWGRRARESFENHWRSANGPNAVKRDWQAAFANWVIEQDNRDGSRPGQRPASQSGHGSTVDAAQRFLARHQAAAGQPS